MLNLGTNKQGLIVYDGVSSTDYGIVVSEAPSFDKPQRKSSVFNVPGRNGSVLFQEDAYNDVTRSYKVFLTDNARNNLNEVVNRFTDWLYSVRGYQRLEDSFEPDIFRLAYFSGGQNFSNEMMQAGETTLQFTCRPERFFKSGETEITVSNGDKLVNATNYTAKPLIYIEASNETVTVSIGGKSIVANVDDYIYIDSERMNAYRTAAENMNSEVSGTFPTIAPGENGIGITGTVTKVTIIPRYYTI